MKAPRWGGRLPGGKERLPADFADVLADNAEKFAISAVFNQRYLREALKKICDICGIQSALSAGSLHTGSLKKNPRYSGGDGVDLYADICGKS